MLRAAFILVVLCFNAVAALASVDTSAPETGNSDTWGINESDFGS